MRCNSHTETSQDIVRDLSQIVFIQSIEDKIDFRERDDHDMETFESLITAKEHGHQLAKQGRIPSIYQRDHREFILLASRETPPPGAYPFLKWVGKNLRDADESEWIPILTKLNSLNRAKEACALFYLLGYEPIIVEFNLLGIFDIFLRESDIPLGGWIVLDTDDDDYVLEIQPPPIFYDEEDEPDFEISLHSE